MPSPLVESFLRRVRRLLLHEQALAVEVSPNSHTYSHFGHYGPGDLLWMFDGRTVHTKPGNGLRVTHATQGLQGPVMGRWEAREKTLTCRAADKGIINQRLLRALAKTFPEAERVLVFTSLPAYVIDRDVEVSEPAYA